MTNIKLEWKAGAREKILNAPSAIGYGIARMTLDMTLPTIPMSKDTGSGRLRRSATNYGVKKEFDGYTIGNLGEIANYAKYVYAMKDSTHWSTPGTNSEWYRKMWNSKRNLIIDTIVEREKLK